METYQESQEGQKMIFTKTKLKNGLKIITAPIKETKAVTVLFLVGTGSRYEDKKYNGISHFLEHMFFKGTNKRPSTLDISQELDSVGASYNAFTSEEETGFYVRVSSDHFSMALDILVDMLFNSKFDSEEIEREKGVILEEINMYQDVPQRYIFDLTKKLFYGDSPLGRSTAGEKETVKKFNRDDFIKYRTTHYNPENMTIVIAGSKNHIDWVNEVKKYLGDYPKKIENKYSAISPSQSCPKVLLYPKKTDQAHLTIGFPTFKRTDKRHSILKIINNVLGETMSSRLFTQVRERRGLAYYIGTDIWNFRDTGAIVSYAGVDLKRVDQAIRVILEEFKKIKSEKITKIELDRAKENLKGRMYLELEDSMSVASFLGEQELFWNKIDSPEQIINDIFKVTQKEVFDLSQELFQTNKINFTMISPFKDDKKFSELMKV
jgi:predicted Zn-dependent peptidase